MSNNRITQYEPDPQGSGMLRPRRRRFRVLEEVRSTVSRILTVEGERGMATRWAVLLRYAAYLAGIAIASLVVGAFPPLGSLATRLFQISCMTIVISAAIAAVIYPTERRNLVEQMRFFVFGVVCFPGIVLGALMSVINASTSGASGHAVGATGDTVMINLAHTTLPYLFWATVVIPPFIFVKMVFGLRKIHRDRTDDEEMMSRLARQDQFFN